MLVRVGGAGACHSDLHLMHEFEAGTLPWTPPFTLGHENAGWVHALGAGVSDFEVGQPVAVVGAWGCGALRALPAGLETYCDRPDLAPVPGGGGGLGLDGGMAEYLLVPAPGTWCRSRTVSTRSDAAPLTDAGLTPYHAVRRSLREAGPRLQPPWSSASAGSATSAVQVLRATTARAGHRCGPRETRTAAGES